MSYIQYAMKRYDKTRQQFKDIFDLIKRISLRGGNEEFYIERATDNMYECRRQLKEMKFHYQVC